MKTEYTQCKFNENGNEDETPIMIDRQQISQSDRFHYLGSVIKNNGQIEKNICN